MSTSFWKREILMKLRNVNKTYHNQKTTIDALHSIDLDFSTTGIVILIGESGCGKTTLLNCIAKEMAFTGTIEDIPNFDYLTQDFRLIEDLSFFENLYLVSKNKKRISEYLDMFELSVQENKKVKYLSNGQKKRVQCIRALLHKPGMLLCDEPTASLDRENCEVIMDALKKLSNKMLIILSTHDEELLAYADRIIQMQKGTIVSDRIIHTMPQLQNGLPMKRHALFTTCELSVKRICSRFWDSIMHILCFLLSILMLFCGIDLYIYVNKQSAYANVFKNGQNLIVSVPNSSEYTTETYSSGYTKLYSNLTVEDLFSVNQIREVIGQNPEIIGVESFNSAQYKQDDALEENDLKAYYAIRIHNEESIRDLEVPAKPLESPFMVSNAYDASSLSSNDQYWDAYANYPDYRIQAFDITNGYQDLPLICGKMPKQGVVLSENAADMYMRLNGYTDYDQILGKKLKIALVGMQNGYKNLFKDESQTVITYADTAEPEGFWFDTVDVVIDGVSSVENAYCTMVFFGEEYGNDPIFQHYVKDLQYVKFQYVRFIVKPGSDYAALAKKINDAFHKPNVKVMQYQGQGVGKDQKFYQSPLGFGLYGVAFFLHGCAFTSVMVLV